VPADNAFPLEHLPYGVFSMQGDAPRIGVAFGTKILDLAATARAGLLDEACPDAGSVFAAASLNPFMAQGRAVWQAVRQRLNGLLGSGAEENLVDRDAATLHLPIDVADYVDFYSSIHHATNVGRMFRPDAEPLLPNWRHLPVGYHGRAGTVVVSGTPVTRPAGQRRLPDGQIVAGPTERLDIELEVGFVVGQPTELGTAVPASAVAEHIFGVVLLNDWSARDVQAWEYQPLGPFLGKSFATSISAWVTPLDALAGARVPPPPHDPEPLAYLQTDEPWALDLDLEVWLRPAGAPEAERVAAVNFAGMYWTVAQQLAHLTVNGASLRVGDLFASGTVSGPEPGQRGCLLELTWNGSEPLRLAGGRTLAFLEDGDEVILRGSAPGVGDVRFQLGEVCGRIDPAR
jgi:fumarylacetoacetase